MKRRTLRRSAGVALVTAIFLLVVLSGLAVAVVSLTTSQQSAAAQDEQSARAYQAARAGIEWALFVSLRTGAGLGADTLGCQAGNSHTFGLPAQTLSAFTVTVTCTQPAPGYGAVAPATDTTGGGIRIRSVACNQPGPAGCPNNAAPGPDYVQRTIDAQL